MLSEQIAQDWGLTPGEPVTVRLPRGEVTVILQTQQPTWLRPWPSSPGITGWTGKSWTANRSGWAKTISRRHKQ